MTSGRVVNLRLDDSPGVYIWRPGKGQEGPFGNPVQRDKTCSICRKIHYSNGATLLCFEKYLRERCERDVSFKNDVLALEGQTLRCFCAPKGGLTSAKPWICHGQPLLAFIEEHASSATPPESA